jgi:hypothetical protein
MPKRKVIPPKNKEEFLSQSSNNAYEKLLAENEYLRAEVAFLKKLAALVQADIRYVG